MPWVMSCQILMQALVQQVKIFGGYTRWAFDLPPPSSSVPARMALTTVDTAHRQSVSPCPGPVHINVQLREPLSPVQHPWSSEVLQVIINDHLCHDVSQHSSVVLSKQKRGFSCQCMYCQPAR